MGAWGAAGRSANVLGRGIIVKGWPQTTPPPVPSQHHHWGLDRPPVLRQAHRVCTVETAIRPLVLRDLDAYRIYSISSPPASR